MSYAFDLVSSQPWLILPDSLTTLLTVSERLGDPAALEARLGRPLDNSRTVSVRNGVAIVPVVGPIFRYANLLTEISGATSTQILATDIRRALDDSAIKAIVLNIDSPGGVASGINELAELIHAGRSQKRIVAYVGGTGASAAYWLASAAHEIVIDETAILGSIGVVVEVVVASPKANGPKNYQIVSRNAPNKRPDLTTEAGRSKVAETVDAMADVFVAKVARNLGVTSGRIPAMGDYGGLRVGKGAVQAGLANRLGSLEGVIASLSKAGQKPTEKSPSPSKKSSPQQAKARLAKVAPNLQSVSQTDEQIRRAGIMALAAPGLEGEVCDAIESGMSVEAAGLRFLQVSRSLDSGLRTAALTAIPFPAARSTTYSAAKIWQSRRCQKA